MASFKTIEEEQRHQEQEYLKNFNSDDYYKDYCEQYNTYIEFALTCLHNAFSLDAKTGDSMLDLGCGPNIYTTIAASGVYKNIVVSDFLEPNRDSIRKWLQKHPSAKDFKYIFKTAAALEHEYDYQKLEARVRNSVKEVIACNVHLSNPIAPDHRQFDVIVSTYTLGPASLTLESYRKSILNVASLLKPGGKFYWVGTINSSYYEVAGHKFHRQPLTIEDVSQALMDAGLSPSQWLTKPFLNVNTSDGKGIFFVKSIKTSQ